MSKSNPRVLVYARVSTSHHEQNPQVQIDELRQYCSARTWCIQEEFIDHGYSGGTDQRPALKQLLALARKRKVDVIVVTKLDRLARSLKHLVSLLDELSSLGIQFISTHDQIDLTTATGRLMIHIVGAFAEFERSLVKERTIAGLEFARSQGKTLGRPKLRDDQAILKLRTEGFSYTQIQKKLGISRPSIHRAIKGSGTKSPIFSNGKPLRNQRGPNA